MNHIWQFQDAKKQLSKLVYDAENKVPQVITRNGKQVAVVLSFEEYGHLAAPKIDLVEFFQSSPLAQIEIYLKRDGSLDRNIGTL